MTRWPTKPLGEVCELVNGRPFKPHEWEEAGLPIIRIQNLTDRTKPFNYTTQALLEKFKVMRGDTLLSWSGTPGTSFGCFRWDGPEGWLNQHIFNVHLDDEVLPPFFIYQVNSKLDELIAKAHDGVGLQHITKGALSSVNVTVPPLAEQERIVKLLDEADELRKLRTQADRRTAALIPSLFHEMFGDPVSNPNGYSVHYLEEICNRITDGTHQPPPFIEKGIPFLFVRNIVSGYIDFDTEKFITEETFAELTRRIKPERGDILYSTVGSYGVAVQVETDRKFAFQRHIGHLKPKRQKIDSGFLAAQLNTPSLKSQADQSARGIAQKTVNLAEIRKFKVVVPPMSLQKEFAARVSEIRAMQAEQAASRRGLDGLFQSLLHRAFQGEL
jgi:type I restriction enzyme S subunit